MSSHLVGSDETFARRLASNHKADRDRAVKTLRKWLSGRPELPRLDALRLWKGLFYCQWMADKVPVQVRWPFFA
jgi:ribosomal RNA-processing protein 1